MNNTGRLVRIGISFELLFDIIRLGYRIENGIECIEGIPDDAEYVYAYTDDNDKILYLVFSHPTFEEVSPGSMIPEMRIVHRVNFNRLLPEDMSDRLYG